MAIYQRIFIVGLLFLLVSCSPTKHSQALQAYQQAKQELNLTHSITALKKLVQLKPSQYQAELTLAEKAQDKLIAAQVHLAQGDYYLAYLLSHDSHQHFPSTENKKVLIQAAKKLVPIIKIMQFISESFTSRPTDLPEIYQECLNRPVDDWDLIKVNSVINQLTQSKAKLTKALSRINSSDLESILPTGFALQRGIKAQLTLIERERDYLPKLAKHLSAKLLIDLNKSLTDNTIELLSMFDSETAKSNSQATFIGARTNYSSYKNLVVNLSLATNLASGDRHASWYQAWQTMESEVLDPQGLFLNYPLQAERRSKNINRHINVNVTEPLQAKVENIDINDFYLRYPAINALTKKLVIDKAILL